MLNICHFINSFRYQNSFWWTMGRNYYTTTFVGDEVDNHDQDPRKYKDLYWSYHKYQSVPLTYEMFQKALTRIRKFHVLLITEWLNGASGMLEEALGWKVPPKKVISCSSYLMHVIIIIMIIVIIIIIITITTIIIIIIIMCKQIVFM